MHGIEEVSEGEYCIYLSEGVTLRVTELSDGKLCEEITRYAGQSEKQITVSDLSTDLQSFIESRTGSEFEG